MAASVNKAILVGNVGKDPTIRTTNFGKIASFSVATSESWRDKSTGERQERTNWHNVVIFNEALVAVVEQYVKKGSKLYLEGQIETRKWEKDGVDRYTTEIVLRPFKSTLTLLDSRGGGGPSPDEYGTTRTREGGGGAAGKRDDMDDEIPF